MLRVIGGWHVGCMNEREAAAAVHYAKECGWMTTRTHYAPVWPEGTPAYELTDAGLAQLAAWSGDKVRAEAEAGREWHRVSARKFVRADLC